MMSSIVTKFGRKMASIRPASAATASVFATIVNSSWNGITSNPTIASMTTNTATRSFSAFPAPKLFDYETIVNNLTVKDAIESVEDAFGKLAKGEVEVPMPMHIGIEETSEAGPGDCHIKGGYVVGTQTFTVKLACVSFYKNLQRGLPAGSGVFVVVDAVTGAPLGIFQENRAMTDLRTGAAGAVAVKYTTPDDDTNVIGFIGAGAIARNMARAAAAVRPNFTGVVYGLDGAESFASDMSSELGVPFTVASSSTDLCSQANVIFTQTPGSETVLSLSDLKPGTTIIASGSDQVRCIWKSKKKKWFLTYSSVIRDFELIVEDSYTILFFLRTCFSSVLGFFIRSSLCSLFFFFFFLIFTADEARNSE